MNTEQDQILSQFKGRFLTTPELFLQKLSGIKAYVFDWDGVFNDGFKDDNGSSAFSEIDAMGTNLLRFNHYLGHAGIPATAIISGEKNKAAFTLAKREHFDAVYYKIAHKADALTHFCKRMQLRSGEVAFVFDDVLDFSAAELCGLRFLLPRACNPMLINFAIQKGLVDYLTDSDGGHHAVREVSELITALSGKYDETITGRMQSSESYQKFLRKRNQPETFFATVIESVITEQPNI
jgi:3-deoxy-D-manno-octulosonate 8-phosphate phosphatase (KDO 8-P phosphatase)